MRLLLFTFAIIWLGKIRASDIRDIEDKVKEGTTATTEIIKALGDDKVSKTFGKIGKVAAKIGPFLGAIGPAVALLSLFSDTPELTAIKEGFANMDKKFDEVFNKFDEVDNLIRETSLKDQYASHELTIETHSRILREMLSASNKTNAEHYKRIFIEKYAHSKRIATYMIFQGMMEEGNYYKNIPLEAMKFYDNDRKKVQKVMKGTIALILQGVKVELAYEKAIGNETGYIGKQTLWNKRIPELVNKAKEFDHKVKDNFHEQMKTDVDKKLKEWRDQGHETFSSNLYNFLNEKYDWRLWFVVSYNELYGSGKHWGGQCDQVSGYHSYRKYGRNLRVASVDYQRTFDLQLAQEWSE